MPALLCVDEHFLIQTKEETSWDNNKDPENGPPNEDHGTWRL